MLQQDLPMVINDDGSVVISEKYIGTEMPSELLKEYSERFGSPLLPDQRGNDIFFCSECHRIEKMDDLESIHGGSESSVVCEECLIALIGSSQVALCDDCQTYWWMESCLWMDNKCKTVCESCADNGYSQCCYCGQWTPIDNTVELESPRVSACDDCRGVSWDYCSECGAPYDNESLTWDDETEQQYCSHCFEDLQKARDYTKGVITYEASRLPSNQLQCGVAPWEKKFDRFVFATVSFDVVDDDKYYEHMPDVVHKLFNKLNREGLIGLVKVYDAPEVCPDVKLCIGVVETLPATVDYLWDENTKLRAAFDIMQDRHFISIRAWNTEYVDSTIRVTCGDLDFQERQLCVDLVNGCDDFFRLISGRQFRTYENEDLFSYCAFEAPQAYNAYNLRCANIMEGHCDAKSYDSVWYDEDFGVLSFRFWQGSLSFKAMKCRATFCKYLVDFCSVQAPFAAPDFPMGDLTLSADDRRAYYMSPEYQDNYYKYLREFLEWGEQFNYWGEVMIFLKQMIRHFRDKFDDLCPACLSVVDYVMSYDANV